jgi:hypothetical protein
MPSALAFNEIIARTFTRRRSGPTNDILHLVDRVRQDQRLPDTDFLDPCRPDIYVRSPGAVSSWGKRTTKLMAYGKRLRAIELRHLRYFIAAAEVGSVTKSAGKLGIQQPPLNEELRALETAVGTPLPRRSSA